MATRLMHFQGTLGIGHVVVCRFPTSSRLFVKRITEIRETEEGDEFFVQGDNRGIVGLDSKTFGFLPRDAIVAVTRVPRAVGI